MPKKPKTVQVGSREYFHTLGRARWVVSNDSMPKHYVKRPGTVYGQTWHGTPLKRIGFDIENLQMANKNYLTQFAKEVATWDALVSPNAYSTQIFDRATAGQWLRPPAQALQRHYGSWQELSDSIAAAREQWNADVAGRFDDKPLYKHPDSPFRHVPWSTPLGDPAA